MNQKIVSKIIDEFMDKDVVFTGCSEAQHSWGSHTGDFEGLVVGSVYNVEKVEVHSWHTKLYLKGIKGSFNSVCFEPVV
jgi:hypothetical protein